MSAIRNIIIAILALSLLTFIALFGQLPALRKTPIGWLQRVLCVHIPRGLRHLDQRLSNGKISRRSERLGNYLFYEKNPVVLITFLIVLTGAAGLFILHGLSRVSTSLALLLPFFLVPPYIFTYLTVTSTSLYITPANHLARSQDYPYDHVLFRPNVVCRTCNLAKPARSKHCSLCNVCVAACDHHCPWVHNCVGRGNYRYFLALLLSLGALQIYGTYLCWYILEPSFTKGRGITSPSASWWMSLGNGAVHAVNVGGLSIAGVGMLAAATACLPFGLFAYHCYLIWAGMTTNESQKWSDWRLDMQDGIVFKTSREALSSHNRSKISSEQVKSTGRDDPPNPALIGLTSDGNEPYVSWPVSSDQIIVSTTDGKPPQGQEALWTRIWELSDVDNIYDMGGWDNLMEILHGR